MKDNYKITLPPVTIETAGAGAKKELEAYQAKYGMIANMSANMANHNALIQTYASGYEMYFAEGDLTPAECELLFLVISRENNCAYCVAGHTAGGTYMTQIPAPVMDAVRNGTPVPDPKLAALVEFAKVMFHTRGNPSNSDVQLFLKAGYTEKNILSIILAIALKTISNYTNHIFHTPNDAMFAPFEWKATHN